MNKCVVVVTHSSELAKQADVVFHLKRGQLQINGQEEYHFGKLCVLALEDNGTQIGEKLFVMLTVDQKKEPAQFVLEDKIVKRSGIFRTAVLYFQHNF